MRNVTRNESDVTRASGSHVPASSREGRRVCTRAGRFVRCKGFPIALARERVGRTCPRCFRDRNMTVEVTTVFEVTRALS